MKLLSVMATSALVFAGFVAAQNCGPAYGNTYCGVGLCCSQHGWCDRTALHCDPATCNRKYSGRDSSCRALLSTTTTRRPTTTTSNPPTQTWMTTIPHIDVCGRGTDNIRCPGAGVGGYYYRCCSGNGHCGPKNGEQSSADYCGTGCQPGYGSCDPQRPVPPPPSTPPTVSNDDTCGPIVNKRCPSGQCCSGSNFCGTGADFCGAANWCQVGWGTCQR